MDLLGRIDAALADGRVESGRGQARALLDIRLRASGKLQGWVAQLGLTPAARATWAAQLGGGGLVADLRRRQAELRERD